MCCDGLAPLIERRRAQTCSIFVLLNIQGRVNLFLDVNGAEMRSDLCRRFKLLLLDAFAVDLAAAARVSVSPFACPIARSKSISVAGPGLKTDSSG